VAKRAGQIMKVIMESSFHVKLSLLAM